MQNSSGKVLASKPMSRAHGILGLDIPVNSMSGKNYVLQLYRLDPSAGVKESLGIIYNTS